jgi:hypothetical protein
VMPSLQVLRTPSFSAAAIDDGEHAAGVAADHPNEIGQRTAHGARQVHRRGVERQLDRPSRDLQNPFGHPVAVRGHLRAQGAQPFGVGVTGGREHPRAAQARDLHGARAVGYESESAFSAAFKRTMGASPRTYARGRSVRVKS